MAARRPAPPPPLPAEQMPGQQGGGLTGVGGHPHCRAARGGFLPGSTPRVPAEGLPARRGLATAKGCVGKAQVGMAKSHRKGHRRAAAAFCTFCWGTETSDTAVPRLLLPCPSAAGRTRHPCPSTSAAAPRLLSEIKWQTMA